MSEQAGQQARKQQAGKQQARKQQAGKQQARKQQDRKKSGPAAGPGPRRGPARDGATSGPTPATGPAAPDAPGAPASGGSGGSGGADWGVYPAAHGTRRLVYAGLAVLGVLTGAAGTLVQAAWMPLGLLLALAGAAGLFWGGAKLCRTKVGAAAPGGGWAVAVLLMTASSPEGDFFFGAGIGVYIFLFGGILAAVMCTTIALPAPPVPANKYR